MSLVREHVLKQRAKYGAGAAIDKHFWNSVAGVSFRRQANAMFYEGKELNDLSGISTAELYVARQFTPDADIERLTRENSYVLEAPLIGEPPKHRLLIRI